MIHQRDTLQSAHLNEAIEKERRPLGGSYFYEQSVYGLQQCASEPERERERERVRWIAIIHMLTILLVSAATQTELAFMTGDVIYVFGEMDEDGFYMGQLAGTGARGLVPSNFLAEATPDPLTASQQAAQTAQHMMQQQHVSYHQQFQSKHQKQQQLLEQLQQQQALLMQQQQQSAALVAAAAAAQQQQQQQSQQQPTLIVTNANANSGAAAGAGAGAGAGGNYHLPVPSASGQQGIS